MGGVDALQFSRRAARDGPPCVGRALERIVVVDHYDAVAGQVDIELEAIRTKRETVVEPCDGVLRPERRPAAMRESEGPPGPARLRGIGQRSDSNSP